MKTAVIIPCYNEAGKIKETILKIADLNFEKKIIVVDDGSKDQTFKQVKDSFNDVILLRHKINLGKGAALKTGCEGALKLGFDAILFVDADGQHSPKFIPEIMEKMEKENLDIVFGSRKMDSKTMPVVFYFGNKFLTFVTNFISGAKISDSQSGFKAFKASVYDKLKWQSCDYSVETEIIVNTAKNKLKYGEIFIDTIYNDKYKGTTPFHGFKILFDLIKYKFQ